MSDKYSSHDWRQFTDDAIVIDGNNNKLEVNDSVVMFTNPKNGESETIDVSRLLRVFVNNRQEHKRSIK